ncbi:MAG: hypothetical protein DRN20_06885 [Thermoplasmata archaeon]|nr:MAG: hypothetical protein DRN20_06885 [Thermoplasmata archaeon]
MSGEEAKKHAAGHVREALAHLTHAYAALLGAADAYFFMGWERLAERCVHAITHLLAAYRELKHLAEIHSIYYKPKRKD